MIASGASAMSESSAIGTIHQARLGFGVPTAVGAGAGAARRFPAARWLVAFPLAFAAVVLAFALGLASARGARPGTLFGTHVAPPPRAVVALDELDVGGHRRPAGTGLREEEDL